MMEFFLGITVGIVITLIAFRVLYILYILRD